MLQTLSDALAERGYDTLTPVQEAVTDPGLAAADLLVSAQTGSGKTVGFGLAIAPTILDEEGVFGPAAAPLALIVAPTRELAFQVTRELGWLYAGAGARVASCVGGMDMRDERRALERGAHVVVGTPGRLRDHIQRGSLDMSGLRAVVLDEADEMLDLGFREDLEFMLGEAPEERRTLMFSATVPQSIVALARNYQRDAVRVTTLTDRSQHADIAYQALRVAPQDAENAIINVLRYHEAQNAIVFANTRASVNRLTARFANRGFAVVCLSGELSQTERSHALQAMRDGRARVCVATDVAARGIDLPNLELVIHAELPSNAEGLLHRSGRTGRAGRKGISALVVPPKATKRAERLLQSARVTAEWTTAPDAEAILRRDEERLLSDPAWSDELTVDEADFAARLVAERSPEAIAAACLRLYRAKHSAPEELSAPEARPAQKERAPFGPSVWFALSVGRDDRAEPRWLLPLLCRAGRLEKESIGAIRVQRTETYVELAEPSVAGFLAVIGEDGALEEGVTARRLDGKPDMDAARPEAASGPRKTPAKPSRPAKPAPARADRDGAVERPRGEVSERSAGPAPKAAKAAEGKRPDAKPAAARTDRDGAGERPRGNASERSAGTAPKASHGKRPFAKSAAARTDLNLAGERPCGNASERGAGTAPKATKGKRFVAKDETGKPIRKGPARPASDKAPRGGAGRPAGRTAGTDTSKRFAGKRTANGPKSGQGTAARNGGEQPPKRSKR